MLFGAHEYFFKQHRDALYRAWPGAGGRPWLGRGRGHWLRSRTLGPGSLDPRSIPARSPLSSLGSLRHSLSQSRSRSESRSLGRGRSVARHSARSRSVGRSVGRSGGRSPGSPGSHVVARRPVARLRCKGSAASRVSTHVHCAHAKEQGTGGQGRASTPAASPSLDAGDDAPEGAEVRRRSHGEQGRTSAQCWGSARLARLARLTLLFSLRHSAHCSGSPASLLDGALLVAATCVRSTGNARRSRALAKFGPCAGRVRHCHSRTQAEAKVKTPLLSNVIAPERFRGCLRA